MILINCLIMKGLTLMRDAAGGFLQEGLGIHLDRIFQSSLIIIIV